MVVGSGRLTKTGANRFGDMRVLVLVLEFTVGVQFLELKTKFALISILLVFGGIHIWQLVEGVLLPVISLRLNIVHLRSFLNIGLTLLRSKSHH